ncbi:hypothetical protein GCM10027051_32220 [Niabella terrae]
MKPIIFLEEDHQLLSKSLQEDPEFLSLSDKEKKQITQRLESGQQVSSADFPNHVSRLHDQITLRNIKTRENLRFRIVPPGEQEPWKGKISAISPLGVLLMGVTEGDGISWQTEKRKKQFVVMELRNAMYI